MVKIIKNGEKIGSFYTCECECEFLYNNSDIKLKFVDVLGNIYNVHTYKAFVQCPCCFKHNILNNKQLKNSVYSNCLLYENDKYVIEIK